MINETVFWIGWVVFGVVGWVYAYKICKEQSR